MRTKLKMIVTLAVTFSFIFSWQVWADDSTYEIANPVTIAPDSGTSRLIAKPEVNFPDTTIVIDRAILDLWISPQTEDTTYISLEIYPISLAWSSETVSWNFPWDNPGGDFDDVNYAVYTISIPQVQNIQVDLTDLCMRWADGRLPYYGFLIAISESSLADVEFLNGEDGTGPFGRMIISYSRAMSE